MAKPISPSARDYEVWAKQNYGDVASAPPPFILWANQVTKLPPQSSFFTNLVIGAPQLFEPTAIVAGAVRDVAEVREILADPTRYNRPGIDREVQVKMLGTMMQLSLPFAAPEAAAVRGLAKLESQATQVTARNVAQARRGLASTLSTGLIPANSNFTKHEIIEALKGTTSQSSRIASAIENGAIGVNILGDDLYDRMIRTSVNESALTRMTNTGPQIYLRKSDPSVLSRIVQEGTHALDFADPGMLGRNRWSWEIRGHFFERQFQIQKGMIVEHPDLGEMLKFIRSNYSNDPIFP